MTSELKQRLEEMAERGEWRGADTVMTAARTGADQPLTAASPMTQQRYGWAAALGAAALVLVLIGGVAWWSTVTQQDEPVVDEPVTTTVPEVTPTTAPVAPVSTTQAVVMTVPTTTSTSTTLAVLPFGWSSVGEDITGGWKADVVAGGPGLVIVGGDDNEEGIPQPMAWTSVDGNVWEVSSLPYDEESECDGIDVGREAVSVAAGPLGVVAVGYDVCDGSAWVSPDGVTWEQVVEDAWRNRWESLRAVTAGGPGWVAVGTDWHGNGVVWVSVDGRRWEQITDEDLLWADTRVDMWDVVDAGPGLVAVGMAGVEDSGKERSAIWVSEDGYEWDRIPDTLIGGGGLFIASSDSGTSRVVTFSRPIGETPSLAWASIDGVNWTRSDPPSPPAPGRAVWIGDQLLAYGRHQDGGDPTLWTSNDGGVTWHRAAMDPDAFAPGDEFFGITEFEGRVVIVGNCDSCSGVWLSELRE